MKKVFLNLALHLTLGIAATLFNSCKKDEVVPVVEENENQNPENPIDSDNQYDWMQITSSISYAADGVTEADRTEITYDNSGRQTGYKYYVNGVLHSQSRDYQYNGRTSTSYSDYYNNGSLLVSTKRKITYSDRNWMQITSSISYAADGVTEADRTEITYDNSGRQTGYKYYVNGVLHSQNRDYQYNGRTSTSYSDYYNNGSLLVSTKRKITYSDKNWMQITSSISYAADGVTEADRAEITYDNSGRQTGYKYYVNGVLHSQNRDYQYNEGTSTSYSDYYDNGSLSLTRKYKTTYRQIK